MRWWCGCNKSLISLCHCVCLCVSVHFRRFCHHCMHNVTAKWHISWRRSWQRSSRFAVSVLHLWHALAEHKHIQNQWDGAERSGCGSIQLLLKMSRYSQCNHLFLHTIIGIVKHSSISCDFVFNIISGVVAVGFASLLLRFAMLPVLCCDACCCQDAIVCLDIGN